MIKIGQIGIGHNHGDAKMLAVRKFPQLFEVVGYAEDNEEWIEKLDKRFDDMVRGAATMTGTTYTKELFSISCRSRKPNKPLNDTYVEMMVDQGETISPIPVTGRGSSDFGDFSQAVPGAHTYFAISDTRIAAHSPAFLEASRSEKGLTAMLKAAAALAYTACKYLADEEMQKQVKQNFEQKA